MGIGLGGVGHARILPMELGIATVIAKPFELDALLVMLRVVLDTGSA